MQTRLQPSAATMHAQTSHWPKKNLKKIRIGIERLISMSGLQCFTYIQARNLGQDNRAIAQPKIFKTMLIVRCNNKLQIYPTKN